MKIPKTNAKTIRIEQFIKLVQKIKKLHKDDINANTQEELLKIQSIMLTLTYVEDANSLSSVGIINKEQEIKDCTILNDLIDYGLQTYNDTILRFAVAEYFQHFRFRVWMHLPPTQINYKTYINTYKPHIVAKQLLTLYQISQEENERSLYKILDDYLDHYVIQSHEEISFINWFIVVFSKLMQLPKFTSTGNFIYSESEEKKLLKVIAKYINWEWNNQKPDKRGFIAVYSLLVSALVLQTRGDRSEFMYKLVKEEDIDEIIYSHQVWMNKIDYLNDKEEGITFDKWYKELNINTKHSWINESILDRIKEQTEIWTCSFAKEIPNNKMKEKYGNVILGYSTQAPTTFLQLINKNENFFLMSTNFKTNISYSKEQMKLDFKYISNWINSLSISEEWKKDLFVGISRYFRLSYKNPQWKHEKEKRVQIFNFDYKNPVNYVIEDNKLKLYSNMYRYPDFIITDNENIKIKYLGRFKELYRYKISIFYLSEDDIVCRKCYMVQKVFIFAKEKEKVNLCKACNEHLDIRHNLKEFLK